MSLVRNLRSPAYNNHKYQNNAVTTKSSLFTVSSNDDDEAHDDDNDAKSFDDNEATKLNIIRLFLVTNHKPLASFAQNLTVPAKSLG